MPQSKLAKVKGTVVLVVLDGWGLRTEKENNGIALANTPWYDHLVQTYPFTQLAASGEAVGLPAGQMGNSEVGHTTIGSGCVIYQDFVRINQDMASGEFARNPAFAQAFKHVQKNKSQLHVIGMLSPGGVHSHEAHLLAVIKAAQKAGVKKIIVHPFLDGRDVPKTAGFDSLKKLEKLISSIDGCAIGSIAGRYYAMDRDNNWDRIDKAFNAIFHGEAEHVYETEVKPSQIIQEMYHQEVFDEFLEPIVFQTKEGKVLEVQTNDALIFTNFRKDRAQQLSRKICSQKEDLNLCFVTMTKYAADIDAIVAYTSQVVPTTIGKIISEAGLKQTHIAETEKFAHATFYLNGGDEQPYKGEDDILLESRKDVKTHDQAPEMRAKEICDAAAAKLKSTNFMFINFANADMIGHTANQKAIIKAIEVVDHELKKLNEAVLKTDGALLIIADHGNAETMVDPITGAPHTAHTTNPVPCILVHQSFQPKLRHGAGLKDVAPTVLELLGLKVPSVMNGKSLIEK